MRRSFIIIGLGGAALALATLLAGPLMSRTEQPSYDVRRADGPIELRAYPPMIVAEIDVRGDRSAAIQQGFRTLADYIFGANAGAAKVAMTAPVLQAPRAGADDWTVRFIMPRHFSLATLPRPKDGRVKLTEMPATTFAAIRFSGLWRDAALAAKTRELRDYMARNGLAPEGAPIYAFYNPPWTLPFLRRNEVLIAVRPQG